MSNTKQNVLYFTPYPSTSSVAAGVRAKYFIEAISENYKVTEYSAAGNKSLIFDLPSNKESNVKRLLKEILVGLEISFRQLFSRYDFYILSSPSYLTNLIFAFSLFLTGRKYVFDVRDIYPEVFFHLGLIRENSIIGRFFKGLTSLVYRNAKAVTLATEGLHDIYRGYNLKTPSKTIFNGFDKETFKVTNKDGEEFVLLFHGNLAKMQNIDLVIDVARRLPSDCKVIVAGDGPQAEKLKSEASLTFLGRVDYKEIPKLVNSAHVGLSFRHDGIINETAFPVKVFEYLGAGLPVITTPHSEAGRFLEKTNLGFQYHNTDVEKIVSKILEIKENYRAGESPLEYSRQGQSQKFKEFVETTLT